MEYYIVIDVIARHPLLAATITLLVLLILMLPYQRHRIDQHGRKFVKWKSALWRWEYDHSHSTFEVPGLAKLQTVLLSILRHVGDEVRADIKKNFWRVICELVKKLY